MVKTKQGFHGQGVGVAVGLLVVLAVGDGETDGDGELSGVGVGVVKMILIAPSSGTGDTVLLPEITTPATIATNAKHARRTVMAASVRRRSSILRL